MSAYATLSLVEYELLSSTNDLPPQVMSVFRESDRRTLPRADGHGEHLFYAAPIETLALRLDVQGFTLEKIAREFEVIRQQQLTDFRLTLADEDAEDPKSLHEEYQALVGLYEGMTFEKYVEAFRYFVRSGRPPYQFSPEEREEMAPVEEYIASDDYEDFIFFGFLCDDVRSFIRMALSVEDPDEFLTYDITDIVASGYVETGKPYSEIAAQALLRRYPNDAPVIVLAEGSSDIDILRKSLLVLFPSLAQNFKFFDFHETAARGGASSLVDVVKAFAASGVANRVMAVLDNDTAAHDARRALKDVVLPDTIRVLHFPEREWLRQYPTLGPSGPVSLDVNGRAGGIELYLGRDVLTRDGVLFPVLWAGYSSAMSAYQGEVQSKKEVLTRWHAKADRCLADSTQVVPEDWEDLRALWEAIFKSLHG